MKKFVLGLICVLCSGNCAFASSEDTGEYSNMVTVHTKVLSLSELLDLEMEVEVESYYEELPNLGIAN